MVEREDGPGRTGNTPTIEGVHTFLLADVRGYTRFTVEQGDEAAARLVGMLADLSEDVVVEYDGAVIELRGDEVLAVFSSTRQALRAALELQARFAQDIESWSTSVGLGIGLDAGEAIPIKGGYRGAALNLAARLCSLAGPGEVLVSDTVVNLARRTVGLDYAERGFVDFKGLSDPVHVFQICLASGKAQDSQQRAIGSTGRPILLDGFRTRLREHLRGLGRTQKELAPELGLHPNRLSHKLGATDRAILTHSEVKRIVKVLAAWEAITTWAEAIELLKLGGLRKESISPAEWTEAPFIGLDPTPLHSMPPSSSTPAPPTPFQPANLPTPLTSFIGQEQEVAAIRELLGQAKLLTLTGTGGTGKTRLALRVAAEIQGCFAEGVAFVPLAGVEDADLVPAVIAQSLGLGQGAGDVHALVDHLRDRNLLLALDNFEHVLTAAWLVEHLLAACSDLTILVTSRVPLRLYGEHEYRVQPLEIGSGTEEAPGPAVQLFVQRARAVQPDFSLSVETTSAVAEICAALDGLPLAIELAAARSKLFTPQAMLPRLRDRLGLLTGGAKNLPQRQQTLRGALDWSHALLGEEERALFRRLAVFSGFDPESAQAVCETGADTLDRLVGLADQSLLEYEPDEYGVRFRMLQTVRDYATARLAESGEAEAWRERHAAHYLQLAQEAEPHLAGPEMLPWLHRLNQELENLRAALGHLLATSPQRAIHLAVLLDRFWGRRSYHAEGRYWLDAALERVPPSSDARVQQLRAKAMVADGVMTADVGNVSRAEALLAEALSIYDSLGDRAGIAATLSAMGEPAWLQGDAERSRIYREEALAIHREEGNRLGIADTLGSLALLAVGQLDVERGFALLDESTALFAELGDRWALASLLMVRGCLVYLRGDHAAAVTLLRDSMRMGQEVGDAVLVAKNLVAQAIAVSLLGDTQRAARVYGAADAAFRRAGLPLGAKTDSLGYEAARTLRDIVDDPAYAATVEEGRTLSVDEAVTLALGEYSNPY